MEVLEPDRVPLDFTEGLGFRAGLLFLPGLATLAFGCTGINPVIRFPVDNSKSDLPDEVRLRRTASPKRRDLGVDLANLMLAL